LNFQHPATNRTTAIALCVAPPRRLEIFMNRDPRYALSQGLEAKQTLVDQLRALVGLTRYLMSSLRSAPRLFFDGLWHGL
jgi:hypothetical protein